MAVVRRSNAAGGHRRVEVLDAAGNPVPVAGDFLAHFSARGCSPNTVLAYGSDLGHLWRFLDAARLGWDALVDRWLAVRQPTSRPITIHHLGLGTRNFLDWLARAEPGITSFAQVTRDHALGYLAAMARDPNPRTGRPLAAVTRRARTSALSVFFRETAAMGWEGVPGRPLLDRGHHPRPAQRVPRFPRRLIAAWTPNGASQAGRSQRGSSAR